jgi:3-oxoacyl-ACP reductase-like protein
MKPMSIFGSIVSAIFGTSKAAPAASAAPAAGGSPSAAASAPSTPATSASPAAARPKPMTRQEVEAMIAKIASTKHHENYNWKQSIVDLMKLLDLDSSLSARKQLAQELGYTGALDGSAEMNTWLHKQVMTKLMESGGVVPDSLK